MNCVDPLRQIKVQFEIPWWSLTHSSRDGLTKGDLPTQTVHGIPKNLPWVWQGLLFCNEYITSQKNVGFQQHKKTSIQNHPAKSRSGSRVFLFWLGKCQESRDTIWSKKSHELLKWMLKFDKFAHDTLDGENFTISKRADRYSWVQFLFTNKENPWKSTTI